MENVRKTFSSSVDIEIAKDFKNISLELGQKPAQLIREFIIGIVEDRVKITPPKKTDNKFHRKLYS